jgi:PIF1-like helicase
MSNCAVLKVIRCYAEPFGGVILLLIGDWYQNRPVSGTILLSDKQLCLNSQKGKRLWSLYLTQVFYFNINFRQGSDTDYLYWLQDIRNNVLTPEKANEISHSITISDINQPHNVLDYPYMPGIVQNHNQRYKVQQHGDLNRVQEVVDTINTLLHVDLNR